jgi:hypothetical protein
MTAIGPEAPSFDEKLAGFDSIPLFMQQLPEGDEDNTALSALQALIHEGTPDGIFRITMPSILMTDHPRLPRRDRQRLQGQWE